MSIDLKHIGTKFPPFSFTIERGKVREFALAIGDKNPAYSEDNPMLPPTFPTAFVFWSDANLIDKLSDLGLDIWNLLHSEQEYVYLGPIKVGDTIIGQVTVTDIYTKEGRTVGTMDFIALDIDYTNQNSELVLKESMLLIARRG
jgi:hypothetical protein